MARAQQQPLSKKLTNLVHASGWRQINGPLFRKYVALLLAVIFVVLLTSGSLNGLLEIGFAYQQHEVALVHIEREQADGAAVKISQFVKGIEAQLGWTVQVPWNVTTFQQRRIDAWRLLRQVSAISELEQIDPSGLVQLRVSRTEPDEVESSIDVSQDPKFRQPLLHTTYYGPVYFRHNSEPYMTLALAGAPDAGVSVAELNLTFMWDAVSMIKVGEHGQAYVVDARGRLIAHRDISLVLRNTDLSALPQVQAARAALAGKASESGQAARDLEGREVLTSYAEIAPLGWLVFVELPIDEAYAPLYQALARSGALLLAGLALAFLAALFLARRMVVHIQTIRAGAARIGSGDLTQRITIRTGDELEALAEQFNRMAEQVQHSYADLERRVDERTHQLEAANLAKSRFIAAASHDLRQPLQALGLFVAQLRDQMSAGEREKIVERAGIAVGEMNELFNALLDISKLDAGVVAPTLSEFPINRLLRRLEMTFTGAAYKRGLRLRVVSSGAWVRSDIIILERILLNVISNAVRFTSRGGVIVGCRRRGTRLRIEVWDSGPGIPEDQQQKIFDEFYQVAKPKRNPGATIGLGLAIVDRLCQLLDYPIELTSSLTRGSRFTIIVPIAAPQSLSEAATPAQVTMDAVTGKTVVVIDDAALVLEGMGGLLRKWGFQVVAAQSCEQALAQFREQDERPDLVVSDYHLPDGKTGIEIIERIRGAFGMSIPAFLVSGDTSPERLREAHAKGYYLLHKPVSPMRLRAVLNQVLQDHAKQRTEQDDDNYSIVQFSGITSLPSAQL